MRAALYAPLNIVGARKNRTRVPVLHRRTGSVFLMPTIRAVSPRKKYEWFNRLYVCFVSCPLGGFVDALGTVVKRNGSVVRPRLRLNSTYCPFTCSPASAAAYRTVIYGRILDGGAALGEKISPANRTGKHTSRSPRQTITTTGGNETMRFSSDAMIAFVRRKYFVAFITSGCFIYYYTYTADIVRRRNNGR